MSTKFGVPPEGEKIQSIVEERLKLAMAENGAKVTVDWRGTPRHLDVISMPVDLLYFNPDTHRIRAQRTLDPARNRTLQEEPWSEPAQEYLRYLLTCNPANPSQTDPDYITLRDELDAFGQKDPGIISPHGILVDGNTRCAALRDLGVKHIQVAVLPSDTSRDDINNVELALQLRRDKRRDYSYINRLIAIEEQLASGRREEDVAREFNIRVKTLRLDRWVYQLIMDAIDRSATDHGARLRLVDFEDHQEKLRELSRDYANLQKTDPEGAEQLKESRLAMVVLGYAKTDVRYVESDFHTRYLEGRLPATLQPETPSTSTVEIPGLPGVAVQDGSPLVQKTRAFTDSLLRAKATAQGGSRLPAQRITEADQVIASARQAAEKAVKLASQSGRLKKKQISVSDRLTDAAEVLEQCAAEFAAAKAKRAIDEEAFNEALLTLRASLTRLAKQAGRTFSNPEEGVAWLLNATRDQ